MKRCPFSSLMTLIVSLFLLPLLPFSTSEIAVSPAAAPHPGTIERTTHQQILTTIPPGTLNSPVPFLTSPSGKYTAYLLRTTTAPAAGGFGNDFCYIQVQDVEAGHTPAWESECTPISTENACTLVFSDDGLAIFDGSNQQWDCGAESADSNPLESVELVDEGDMRIRDNMGELAWRASDDPLVNQRCGEPGSPGIAPALPPFAQPIGTVSGNIAFGQQPQQGSGVSQTFGFGDEQQPSLGYNSGSKNIRIECWFGVAWALVVGWFGCGFVF